METHPEAALAVICVILLTTEKYFLSMQAWILIVQQEFMKFRIILLLEIKLTSSSKVSIFPLDSVKVKMVTLETPFITKYLN